MILFKYDTELRVMLLVQPDFPGVVKQQKGSRGGVTLIMGQVCARTRGRNLFFFSERTMIHNGILPAYVYIWSIEERILLKSYRLLSTHLGNLLDLGLEFQGILFQKNHRHNIFRKKSFNAQASDLSLTFVSKFFLKCFFLAVDTTKTAVIYIYTYIFSLFF